MMQRDQQRALDKIKKCLALASSSNEHEAAAALRQAHALMKQHNLTHRAVLASQVQEIRVRTRYKARPPVWDQNLAGLIADQFDCKGLMLKDGYCVQWLFVGEGANPEIAEYAYDVLLNQVLRTRRQFLIEHLGDAPAGLKRKLGDHYCSGWVSNLSQRIAEFARQPQASDHIEAYLAQQHITVAPAAKAKRRKTLSQNEYYAFHVGQQDARQVKLHRGVGSADDALQLENGVG